MATSMSHAVTDSLLHQADVRYEIPSDPDPFKPYDHQVSAWDGMTNHFGSGAEPRAGLVVIPTGGGKTATAARWLLRNWVAKGGRVLWLAHRQSLLWQAHHAFQKACREARAHRQELRQIVVSGDAKRWSNVDAGHDVVLSTIQTASTEGNIGFLSLMAEQSPQGLFLVVDEAHHAAARSYQTVVKMLRDQGCPLLGLTATPMRMDADDNRRLWATFDHKVIVEVTKQHLISRDILAEPVPSAVKTNVEFEREFTEEDLEHLRTFGELSAQVASRIASHSGRNHLIVEHWVKNRDKYGKTLVFAVDTLHARTLVHEFEKAGVAADYVDYTRGKHNRDVLEGFRTPGAPEVLCNVEMLTEGVDLPNTQTVFLVRPTRSEALLNQMIGRALRGVYAGGTKQAHLVTFVDTWEHFSPLELSIVIDDGTADEPELRERLPSKLVIIGEQLVREAYKLVQSVSKGTFEGYYECLPHSWYVWEAEYSDDIQMRSLLVFENQVKGFEALVEDFNSPSRIPESITEPYALDLIRRYFGDCPDPLPSWMAIAELLEAKHHEADIQHYTFEEKAAFDPQALARSIQRRNLGERDKHEELQKLFDDTPVCQHVYQGDALAFFEDVDRALMALRDHRVPAPPSLVELVPEAPRPWSEGDEGYRLTEIWERVAAVKRHFPKGAPTITDIRYMDRPDRGYFGFYRTTDRTIQIHPALNSPDVPVFAMEFLVYHELLHADMPQAQHNRDFRARERRFQPSELATSDALRRGFKPGPSKDGWRVISDQFFDTFESKFSMDRRGRGKRM